MRFNKQPDTPTINTIQYYVGLDWAEDDHDLVIPSDPLTEELRCAVHLWTNLSQKKCAWAEAYYRAHRENGKSHACALRCLGQRLLKILWRMWQDQSPYNEAIHLKNQVKHGSWNLQLNPQ